MSYWRGGVAFLFECDVACRVVSEGERVAASDDSIPHCGKLQVWRKFVLLYF